LFELGCGRPTAALALFEGGIRPGRSQGAPFSTVVDSVSLLWRCELAGAAAGPDAWRTVADFARDSFPSTGFAFLDVHCAAALAAAGDHEALARWLSTLRRADAEGRIPTGTVVPRVAEAMAAFAARRYDETIAALAPVLEQLVRVGGSWAQRDLFEYTLLAAYLRAGRHEEARALLGRRLARPRSVPVAGV
jgi:hypothetical protein